MADREEIALAKAAGLGVREIARQLGKAGSTISRELQRNRVSRGYRAVAAQGKAEARARRPKPSKLATDSLLRAWVQDKLERLQWSPEQISRRLREEFPDDESMRISHEAIYQALYVQGRGALRRELTVCLRTGRALRKPHRRADARRERIKDKILISDRPAEADDRAVPGHWEGDLIIGEGSGSAIGTLVERSTRFLMLLHLPTDHGAEAVRDASWPRSPPCPPRCAAPSPGTRAPRWPGTPSSPSPPTCDLLLRPTLTLATRHQREHQRPAPPVLPQGHRPLRPRRRAPRRIADRLNGRPRKTLGFKTPAEVLARLVSEDQMTGVATTT